jgi:dipeptidyl aminopeptidase/acylaminoacyl peptidase
MTPVDMIGMPTLSNPRISPDAKSVVFTRSLPDWDENKSAVNLWLSDATSGKSRQLTFSEESKKSPAWSPDGAYVSFLMDASLEGDDEEEYKAIHLLPMNGGQAYPIGEHLSDVVSYEWAPSAEEIYFLADVPLSEEHRERREAKDDMQPFDEPLSERHLWRMSIEDRVIEQITEAGRYVRSFDLSDDGNLLAYSSADGMPSQ